MRKVDFKQIKGLSGISRYFDTSIDFLNELADTADQSPFYEELRVPKKNKKRRGEVRVVYKASSQISQFQKNVATAISNAVQFPNHVQGFVKERSSSSNAKQHLGCQILLNADIKDFFDSIALEQVSRAFVELGCDEDTANILSRLCTLNGVLCQGLHTSPILSNLVVTAMDDDLIALSQKHSATYTRYADDISISSEESLPTKQELADILNSHGFQLHPEKFRITKRGQAQFVTGLSVFDSKYPRIPKRTKQRLRLELYFISKYGLVEHFQKAGVPDYAYNYAYNRLRGMIDYINAVEPSLAEKLYKLLPYRPNYKQLAEELKGNPEMLPKIMSMKMPKREGTDSEQPGS